MRRPKQLIMLKTRDGIDDVVARLQRGPLAVDTETSGLDWKTDLVGALNLAAGETAVCAVQGALGPMVRWLGDQVRRERELVFHNAKYDLHMLRRTFGLRVPYPVHDTAVESFVVDNRGAASYDARVKKRHGLKALAALFVDVDAGASEAALLAAIKARGGKHKGDWALLLGTEDERLFTDYSALDAWCTLELHRQFYLRILYWVQPSADVPSLRSVYERERWVLLALRDMEERGIRASRAFLEEWRSQLATKLEEERRELARLAGREINWNSVPQLKELLYTRGRGGLGIRGGPGTDAVTLLRLPHAIGPAMVRYRETFKQWSSYANSLLAALTPGGTIHPTFRSTGADTSRTSCVEPNLQQQTRVSGVRRAYHPREGLVFRFADYSQVEMRFAAHFANERSLIDGFNHDPDFDTHGTTARNMFGRLFDPSSQHRKFGKIINFTKLFGGGENKVTEQLIDLISEREARAGCRALKIFIEPGLTPWRALARGIIERFNASMPGFAGVIRDEARRAEARGYVLTAFGSHRFMGHDDDRWYAAFNGRVQGTAAIQAKQGLVDVYRECQLNRGELALLLIIHDELIYESEGDPRIDRRVLELMRDLTSYKVPIIADISGSTTNWQDKVKVKL